MTRIAETGFDDLLRVDPALRDHANTFGLTMFARDAIEIERRNLRERHEAAAIAVDTQGVHVETRTIIGPEGDSLSLRVYRGAAVSPAPVVVYAHGGLFVSGDLDTDHGACVELARSVGCVVVSIDYRLAPEYPCPAALDDVEAAFSDVIMNATEYGIDAKRVAVMGRDAGAALVAGLTHRLFDNEGPSVRVQVLHHPMLDCDTSKSRRVFRATPVVNGQAVENAWSAYLGTQPPSDRTVPAHRANLEGLPPCFVSVAEVDPTRDEAIDYAVRLLDAHVPTELEVVAATFHDFDSAVPSWEVSRRTRQHHAQVLKRALSKRVSDRPGLPTHI